MALPQTKAAAIMQENVETISSHQVISLLMDGALERIEQGVMAIHANNQQDHLILKGKLIAILNGLRHSLNLERGGDIATNLNELYLYMTDRLSSTEGSEHVLALTEVRRLLIEVKYGWDNMPTQPLEVAFG